MYSCRSFSHSLGRGSQNVRSWLPCVLVHPRWCWCQQTICKTALSRRRWSRRKKIYSPEPVHMPFVFVMDSKVNNLKNETKGLNLTSAVLCQKWPHIKRSYLVITLDKLNAWLWRCIQTFPEAKSLLYVSRVYTSHLSLIISTKIINTKVNRNIILRALKRFLGVCLVFKFHLDSTTWY